jgi:uncharacterized protein YgiM (DUF1202 family)
MCNFRLIEPFSSYTAIHYHIYNVLYIVVDSGAQGTATTAPLRVRAEPALTSRVIGTLPAGSQMNVLDQQGSWYQIEYAPGPGGKGWVSAHFIQVGSGSTSRGTDTGTGAGATSTAGPRTGTASGDGSGTSEVPAPEVVAYQAPVLRWK